MSINTATTYRSRGIAIKKTRFSETSLIVTWLTETHGKISTVARGTLKTTSSLAGRVDLYHETEIQFTHTKKAELYVLQDATIINKFEAYLQQYTGFLAASYFAMLVASVLQNEDSDSDIYGLLSRGIKYLTKATIRHKDIVFFENELATYLGIYHKEGGVEAYLALKEYANKDFPLRKQILDFIKNR